MSKYSQLPAAAQLSKMRSALKKAKSQVALTGKGAYKRRVMRGKGDFFEDLGKGVIGSLDKITGGIARKAVNRVGQFVTGKGAYRRMRGRGDYYYQGAPMDASAAAGAIDMGQNVPEFMPKNRYTEVCHSEYIQDISSSTSFTNTVFPINPGIAATFPWLSQVAQNFEEYKFEQLVFYYKTTSALALNSTNTALGVVVGATNYNVTQPAFTSKQQMESYEYAKSAPPAVSQTFPVECNRSDNVMDHMFIRSGSLGANQDIRLNDFGNFQIATTGSQAAAVTGELWVSYRVKLYKSSLSSVGVSSILSSHYGKTAFTSSVLSAVTSAHPFGGVGSEPASTSYEVGSNVALTFNSSAGTITFPASVGNGSFIMYITYIGASTALTNAIAVAFTTNCSAMKIFNGSSVAQLANPAGVTSTTAWCISAFSVTGQAPVITINASTFTVPGTLSAVDIIVVPINNNILTKKQAMTRNVTVRRVDDPLYDPSEGKYITEEMDELDDHMHEGEHHHTHYITKQNDEVSLETKEQRASRQDEELELLKLLQKRYARPSIAIDDGYVSVASTESTQSTPVQKKVTSHKA